MGNKLGYRSNGGKIAMRWIQYVFGKLFNSEYRPLTLTFLLLLLDGILMYCGSMYHSHTKVGILIKHYDYSIILGIILTLSSLVLGYYFLSLSRRYLEWLKASKYSNRYYKPNKLYFISLMGLSLLIMAMLFSAWIAPKWAMTFQVSTWLYLFTLTIEVKPERISKILDKAMLYEQKSMKELSLLAYSRRFSGFVVGLLVCEYGAMLVYLLTYRRVANYTEAVSYYFVVTLILYLILYIPFFWGSAISISRGK